MNTFTHEYRAWMIQEINSTLTHPLVDTDLMTPDGTSYVQCIWIGDQAKSLTEDQQLIAAQLKAWGTTE